MDAYLFGVSWLSIDNATIGFRDAYRDSNYLKPAYISDGFI